MVSSNNRRCHFIHFGYKSTVVPLKQRGGNGNLTIVFSLDTAFAQPVSPLSFDVSKPIHYQVIVIFKMEWKTKSMMAPHTGIFCVVSVASLAIKQVSTLSIGTCEPGCFRGLCRERYIKRLEKGYAYSLIRTTMLLKSSFCGLTDQIMHPWIRHISGIFPDFAPLLSIGTVINRDCNKSAHNGGYPTLSRSSCKWLLFSLRILRLLFPAVSFGLNRE